MARVGEECPLACPACGGDIRLIAFGLLYECETIPGLRTLGSLRLLRTSRARPGATPEDSDTPRRAAHRLENGREVPWAGLAFKGALVVPLLITPQILLGAAILPIRGGVLAALAKLFSPLYWAHRGCRSEGDGVPVFWQNLGSDAPASSCRSPRFVVRSVPQPQRGVQSAGDSRPAVA
jgi:hypothetical protein